jgi:hypothetical protein
VLISPNTHQLKLYTPNSVTIQCGTVKELFHLLFQPH